MEKTETMSRRVRVRRRLRLLQSCRSGSSATASDPGMRPPMGVSTGDVSSCRRRRARTNIPEQKCRRCRWRQRAEQRGNDERGAVLRGAVGPRDGGLGEHPDLMVTVRGVIDAGDPRWIGRSGIRERCRRQDRGQQEQTQRASCRQTSVPHVAITADGRGRTVDVSGRAHPFPPGSIRTVARMLRFASRACQARRGPSCALCCCGPWAVWTPLTFP
jgi:hypothetical protein